MKRLILICAFAALLPARAYAFDPVYMGQGSYNVDVGMFADDRELSKQVSRFCRSKGYSDFVIGYRTTDVFGTQNFVCMNEGDTVEPLYPGSHSTVTVVPFGIW